MQKRAGQDAASLRGQPTQEHQKQLAFHYIYHLHFTLGHRSRRTNHLEHLGFVFLVRPPSFGTWLKSGSLGRNLCRELWHQRAPRHRHFEHLQTNLYVRYCSCLDHHGLPPLKLGDQQFAEVAEIVRGKDIGLVVVFVVVEILRRIIFLDPTSNTTIHHQHPPATITLHLRAILAKRVFYAAAVE
ncbi:hypothetical protein EJ08DRAFT_524316 [Tothia fuscella]|uniref:Uncharacterized protein n=1 Tax=Tothia fuscella TaxID=1048955 RepID=A0A9P4NH94_9PEZI|nr:hypothetical protein EJ08DRAFT_524316 [Tothia fuscella]